MASQGIELKDLKLVFLSANLHLSSNETNYCKKTWLCYSIFQADTSCT